MKPLPNDTFLLASDARPFCYYVRLTSINRQAVFDTCHSGTILDLPHHHCNSVYVPWLSKGVLATRRVENNNGTSLFYPSRKLLQGPAYPVPLIASVISSTTQVGESAGDWQPNRHWRSMGDSKAHPAREGRLQRRYAIALSPFPTPIPRWKSLGDSGGYRADILSPTRYDSPVSNVRCDGWCKHDIFARRVAVSVALIFRARVGQLN